MSARIKARLKKLLAQEKGAVVREWGASFPIALVYPQIYPVAMGNLGFQAIYHLLNTQPGLVCERAFLPTREEWQEHRRTRTSVLTLESQRPLTEFAAVAFSISFEADYPYVLQILAPGAPPGDRGRVLQELARTVPGAYVPAGYRPRYHRDGTLAAFEAQAGFPEKVTAPHLPELAPYPIPSHILAPQSEWGEMFLVETARGCSRGG